MDRARSLERLERPLRLPAVKGLYFIFTLSFTLFTFDCLPPQRNGRAFRKRQTAKKERPGSGMRTVVRVWSPCEFNPVSCWAAHLKRVSSHVKISTELPGLPDPPGRRRLPLLRRIKIILPTKKKDWAKGYTSKGSLRTPHPPPTPRAPIGYAPVPAAHPIFLVYIKYAVI